MALSGALAKAAAADRSPAARDAMLIKIGAFSIALRASDAAFREMILRRYAPFLAAPATGQNELGGPHNEADFEFHVIPSAPQANDAACGADVSPDDEMRVYRQAREWRAERGDFSAAWDARTGRGWFAPIQRGLDPNPYPPYSTDTLFRVVHSLALAERGGFLLHAASVIRNGRAFLLSGVSGAGKTTLARLAPPEAHILTDEISYIAPRGEDGYVAYGTPFAGELARVGENLRAPLAGVFFLEKARRNQMHKMEPRAALRALLRNILFLANDQALIARLFGGAPDFLARVPAYRMQFTPDARAWEMIA